MIMSDKKIIIIVDDDLQDVQITMKALEGVCEKNIEIIYFLNPDEMFMAIEKIYDKKTFFPIILLDIKMGIRDGFETLKTIKTNELLKKIPIIMYSSTISSKDVTKSYQLGANSFLSKKIDFKDIIQDMENLKRFWFETVILKKEEE